MSEGAGKPPTAFDYLNAVTHTKDLSFLDRPTFEKEYSAFVINRALSYHQDSVLAANLMNERYWIAPRLQFLFLLNTLRPRKRYSKWLKRNVPDAAKIIAEYYGCSLRHAIPLVGLHSAEQLAHLQTRLQKGGMGGGTKTSK